MLRFFFYGTLLDADVRRAVLPRQAESLRLSPALLRGYRRVRIPQGGYPILIRACGATVRGQVAEGLDRESVLRMAHFEGIEYLPWQVGVVNGRGQEIRAWSFQAPTRRIPHVGPWDIRRWRHREKQPLMPKIESWFAPSTAATLESLDISWRMRRWIVGQFPDGQ